ncbi:MAG: aminotransferase class V-fold PLP-dependent enzyme [Anaerolineae bacterium]|nr:aminotransferase class V-fold PLP-dependent enzyme [Anaerolineae bacterium]MDQ7036004.1 aminotransferase class V-fold PLP-dependent enzyme [Anaerolineae bacterium]
MRDLFLLDPKVIFLNHGSFGACPKEVFDHYQSWQRALETQPVAFLGRRAPELIQKALSDLGQYLGTSGENLVFVANATSGLNTVARSLKLSHGDEILTTDHEYGALELTWQYHQRERGIHIQHQTLPLPMLNEDDVVEAIWSGVTARTRVIFLSHITSPTALILPVQEICRRAREAGIITIIDGAHVPGQIPLNLDELGADFYSGNCHKWMSSPKGSAFLYVNPDYHEMIDPLVISWGWDGDTLFERTKWQGTRDISAYLSMPEAIRFMEKHDWDTVRANCHELAIETMHRICEVTGMSPIAMPRFFGQMVAAPLPPDIDVVELKNNLYDEYNVEVPIFSHHDNNYTRVSIQAYNTRQDIDTFIRGLAVLL